MAGQIFQLPKSYSVEQSNPMKQYQIRAANFRQSAEPHIPDAHLDPSDLVELQKLAGIGSGSMDANKRFNEGSNISVTANEKAQLMKNNNIQPGTPEWFQLWFSRPYLTGEKPTNK